MINDYFLSLGIIAFSQILFLKRAFLFILLTFTALFGIVRGESGTDTAGTSLYLDSLAKYLYSKSDSVKPQLDSVIKTLENFAPSTTLEKAYKLMSNLNMYRQHYEISRNYLNKIKRINEKLNDSSIYKDYLFDMGTLYNNLGNVDSAEFYYDRFYRLAKRSNDTEALARIRINMAAIRAKQNDYDSSIKLLYEAEPWFVKQKNYFRLALLYNALGNDYMRIGKFDEAYKYYQMALKNDSLTDKVDLSTTIISNIAYTLQTQKKYDEALKYYDQLMELMNPHEQMHSYNIVLLNLANVYYAKKDFRKALSVYKKIYQSPLTENITDLNTAVTINLASTYANLKKYDSADYFIQKGLALAKQNKLLDFLRNAYDILYSLDSARGRWKDAVSHLKKEHELSDSLINEKMMNSIEQMRIKKELEKEKAITEYLERENRLQQKLLRRRNYLIGVMTLALVLIILLLLKVYRSNRKILLLSEKVKQRNLEIDKANKELKNANRELKELNDLQTKFFSVISHDLRSPFNSLFGITEMLQDESYEITEEERKEMISVLRSSIENVYGLLENLLEWSRVQMHGIKPYFQKVDLHEVVRQSIELYKLMAENKEITVTSETEKGTFVNADKRLVSNVVNNLLNNALKFTERGGSVKIFVKNKNGTVETCIDDTGVGIPEEKLKNIFSAFSDNKTYGTEHEKGSGLGLSLCKEYIELMKGSIKMESTQGKGTTVCFTLPSYDEQG